MDNKERPLVSIVMCVKNVQDYIVEALNSVKAQTYGNFECIIVDDYSDDATPSIILDTFCQQDKRFKLYVNCADRNVPYCDGHNLSYKLAKGKYLVRFDGDDIMRENHVESLVDYMEKNPTCDAVCSSVKHMIAKDGVLVDNDDLPPVTVSAAGLTEDFNRYNAWIMNSNYMVWCNQSSCMRKSFYDIKQPVFTEMLYGDYLFWWSVIAMGGILKKIDSDTLIYRYHDESITRSIWTEDDLKNNHRNSFEALLALYKRDAFRRYPSGYTFPDGGKANDFAQVFENTRVFFEKRI